MIFLVFLAALFGVMNFVGCISATLKSDRQLASTQEIARILWLMVSIMIFKWIEQRKLDKEFRERGKRLDEDRNRAEEVAEDREY